MIKLSDYVFKFLEKSGVRQAFMLPGGGAMHLDDSIGKSNIGYVCCLHEQAAAIAAEAYGQHTNTPALVLVTSGPGATNAITGVTAGWIDSTPMIIISGQSKRQDLVGDKGVRQIGSQEVQIVPMVTPITKYAVQVLRPEEIRYHLEKAFYEATNGRPGPVWIDIPLDVQAYVLDEKELKGFVPDSKMEADDAVKTAVNRTVELLNNSIKPLILAGNGIKLAGAANRLYQLVENYRIPVETTWKTIDMFGEEDDVYVGHPGIMGDRGANLILQEADLLISVGCRLDTSVTAFNDKNFAKSAKKIIVDIDQHEIDRMDVEKEVEVSCDAGVFLNALYEEMQNSSLNDVGKKAAWEEWREGCKATRKKYPVVTNEHSKIDGFVSAYYFIGELCKQLRSNDIIVPESSGGAGEITYQAFELKKGQKMKNAAGLGSMGFGLPYAIGSCIANDRRRTILINGDGAFQLNIQELETLHRLKLPIKIFIWNNHGYASIRFMQRNNFDGHYVASEENSGLTMPDISKVANAYGFQTYQIHNNRELDNMLPIIMADDSPLLCELMVMPEETVSPRVKAVVGENGKMTSGPLENMWPYLVEEKV